MASIYLNKEEAIEVWGEGFEDLAANPQVKFTQENVQVTLKRSKDIVSSNGEKGNVIYFEEPDLATLKLMDTAKGEISKIAILIQACAGIPAASANKIKAADVMLLSKVVAGFLGKPPETSGTV